MLVAAFPARCSLKRHIEIVKRGDLWIQIFVSLHSMRLPFRGDEGGHPPRPPAEKQQCRMQQPESRTQEYKPGDNTRKPIKSNM